MAQRLEELINSLYETIQDAKNVPLSSDKCIIEREKVMDTLDEIRALLPSELKMARELVEKRNEFVEQGKREVAELRKKAEDYVRKTVNETAIMTEANAQAQKIVADAQSQANQLKAAAQQFCDDQLRETEACAEASLQQIRQCRQQFINMRQ